MNGPIAFWNGQFLATERLTLSIHDTGFVVGATITEKLRSFRGELFRLDDHLDRLYHSAELAGIDPGMNREKLGDIGREIVSHNCKLIEPGDDIGLCIFITPGLSTSMSGPPNTGPTVCLHTYPQPFDHWARKYSTGDALAISRVRQVPKECWSPEIKCRSRMHYFLADQEAEQRYPGARAVLLDKDGNVTETSSANVVIYQGQEGIVSPPPEDVLGGISLKVASELAASLEIAWSHRKISPADLQAADEVISTSTPYCALAVTHVDGKPVGSGRVGPVYTRLLAAWSDLAGIDIAAQAERFARRRTQGSILSPA
jgi:branched-subunit amino acid aminotransferase/4-amino-4-deoxychorismate lyase